MKILSPGISALLQQRLGLEPVNILEIQWVEDGQYFLYADKDIDEGIRGKILEVSTLESVVKLDSQGQSQGISVILSDSEGDLKNIFDNHDIHGRRCVLTQWFAGLSLDERFQIYEGEISSPIVWNEGDRTLRFEVITKLSDKEVGFSPEEGFFNFLPDESVGVPWPLAFGKVGGVPATRLSEVPNSNIAEPLGVPDPSLGARMTDLRNQDEALYQTFMLYALGAAQAASGCADGYEDQCALQEQFEDMMAQIAIQRGQIQQEMINVQQYRAEQEEVNAGELNVLNGSRFPQNQLITVQVENTILTGTFSGSLFTIRDMDITTYTGYNPQDPEPFGFTWYREGTQITIQSSAPIVYIANIIPSTILSVQTLQQIDNGQVLITVPPEYYSVANLDIGPYIITYITFSKPLSSFDSTYSDDIFVTLESTVGPNTVDILIWLITTYTDLAYDTGSFEYVRDKLENYPSHFALLDRRDIIQVLEEIAFQARCSIWIADNTFFIKYLAEELDGMDTITEDDIDVTNSFNISLSTSEEIVTKLVALWRSTYTLTEPNKIVLRHNVKKYGTKEREIDFYIYNIQELVLKSATFWLIRFANVWKYIEFTTYIDKIAIETFDTIEFDFSEPFIANTAVKGTIVENTYDSDEKIVTMKAWLPVRAGEMEVYDFAEPSTISIELYFPTPYEIGEGFAGGDGPGTEVEGFTLRMFPYTATYSYETRSDYEASGARYQRRDWGDLIPSDLDDTKPEPQFVETTYLPGTRPTYDYQYPRYTLDSGSDEGGGEDLSRCYPGTIVSGSDDTYMVNVYVEGLSSAPTLVEVRQLQIAQDSVLPPGTWVLVAANTVTSTGIEGEVTEETEYTMQVPVWL